MLAWDYQYRLSREEVMKGMYDTIKRIKPSAPVGWHVDHWATSMDIIARAAMSYAEMAPWSDYLKVVVYHAVTAPRMRTWVGNEQKSILSDLPLEDALKLHYALFGYDPRMTPRPNEPTPGTASPDYVFRETKRSVASAAGQDEDLSRHRLQPARRRTRRSRSHLPVREAIVRGRRSRCRRVPRVPRR